MESEDLIKRIKTGVFKSLLVLLAMIGIFVGLFSYVRSSTDFLSVSVTLGKKEGISPDEKIILNFSSSVMPVQTQEAIKITPSRDVFFAWKNSNKTLEIHPKETWKNGERYMLEIENGKSFLVLNFSDLEYFSIEDYPAVISVFPAKGEKNVTIDIEDPVVVGFDRSLDDYDVNIKFNTGEEFFHEINEKRDSIKIMPKNNLEPGRRYDLRVDIRHKKQTSESDYKNIFESHFETKQLEIKEWSKDVPIRLFQAKNYTQPKISEGKYIDINLKSQVMVIFENGTAQDAFLISSGRRGMETPQGSFQIHNKHARPWSKKYSLFMPFWMAITSSGEFGIHELPEWPGGYKEGANHLGIPVSHGCVRLGIGPAEKVYNWSEIGTPIIIHY